jgi:hypothetical protein
MLNTMVLVGVIVALAVLAGALLILVLKKAGRAAPVSEIRTVSVAERIRAVGKLVGLEVHAKEIATSTRGWGWIPPLLLSQAKIAMIFHFEKQYFADLSLLRPADVEAIEAEASDAGRARYRVHLPPIEGSLRLTEVSPYDIQAGRVLGLLDVIPMTAETQRALMQTAHEQATDVFRRNEAKYMENARRSIEQHLAALLRLFEVGVEVAWREEASPAAGRLDLGESVARQLQGVRA